jgi:hypothetical protein
MTLINVNMAEDVLISKVLTTLQQEKTQTLKESIILNLLRVYD